MISLMDHFAGELVSLSSPGYATMIVFRQEAAVLLKMVKNETTSDIDANISMLAKQIVQECKSVDMPSNSDYNIHYY